jgi:predicted nucleic acid-binding protein
MLKGKTIALASVALFVEYEAVMSRPEHLRAAGATVRDVRNLLDVLAGTIEPVQIRYLWRPWLPDADDDMVLECAVNGSATCIVTFTSNDFRQAAAGFSLRVLVPGALLKELQT